MLFVFCKLKTEFPIYEGTSKCWHCSDGSRWKKGRARKEGVACTASQSFSLRYQWSKIFKFTVFIPWSAQTYQFSSLHSSVHGPRCCQLRSAQVRGYRAEYIFLCVCLFVCSYNTLESLMSTCVFSCRPKYSIRENRSAYKVFMWLVIRSFGSADIGTYNCVSTNSLGRAEGTLRLYGESYCTWTESTVYEPSRLNF